MAEIRNLNVSIKVKPPDSGDITSAMSIIKTEASNAILDINREFAKLGRTALLEKFNADMSNTIAYFSVFAEQLLYSQKLLTEINMLAPGVRGGIKGSNVNDKEFTFVNEITKARAEMGGMFVEFKNTIGQIGSAVAELAKQVANSFKQIDTSINAKPAESAGNIESIINKAVSAITAADKKIAESSRSSTASQSAGYRELSTTMKGAQTQVSQFNKSFTSGEGGAIDTLFQFKNIAKFREQLLQATGDVRTFLTELYGKKLMSENVFNKAMANLNAINTQFASGSASRADLEKIYKWREQLYLKNAQAEQAIEGEKNAKILSQQKTQLRAIVMEYNSYITQLSRLMGVSVEDVKRLGLSFDEVRAKIAQMSGENNMSKWLKGYHEAHTKIVQQSLATEKAYADKVNTGVFNKLQVKANELNALITKISSAIPNMPKGFNTLLSTLNPEQLKTMAAFTEQYSKAIQGLSTRFEQTIPKTQAAAKAYEIVNKQVKNLISAVPSGKIPSYSELKFLDDKTVVAMHALANEIPGVRAGYNALTKDAIGYHGWLTKTIESTRSYMRFQIDWFLGAGAIFSIFSAIKAMITAALEFQQTLKNIQAVTGQSSLQIDLIADAAMNVARTTPMAAVEASKMGLQLIRAGLNAEEAASALQVAAKVAVVSGEDAKTVADTVATAIMAWGISADNAEKIGNTLAAALNYSKLTIQDLGVAFNYAAGVASSFGHSLEETVSIMAVYSNLGVKASTIATGWTQLMSEFLAPSKKAREYLASINVAISDINPTTHTFAEILERLEKAGFNAARAMEIFEVRAGRSLIFALRATSDEFKRMNELIEKSKQLQDGIARVMEGPIAAFKRLWGEISIAAIYIGQFISPILSAFANTLAVLADGLGSVVNVLASWPVAIAIAAIGIKKLINLLIKLNQANLLIKLNQAKLVSYTGKSITIAEIVGTAGIAATIAKLKLLFSIVLNFLKLHPTIRLLAIAIGALFAIGGIGKLFGGDAQKAMKLNKEMGETNKEMGKIREGFVGIEENAENAVAATDKFKQTLDAISAEGMINTSFAAEGLAETLKELEPHTRAIKEANNELKEIKKLMDVEPPQVTWIDVLTEKLIELLKQIPEIQGLIYLMNKLKPKGKDDETDNGINLTGDMGESPYSISIPAPKWLREVKTRNSLARLEKELEIEQKMAGQSLIIKEATAAQEKILNEMVTPWEKIVSEANKYSSLTVEQKQQHLLKETMGAYNTRVKQLAKELSIKEIGKTDKEVKSLREEYDLKFDQDAKNTMLKLSQINDMVKKEHSNKYRNMINVQKDAMTEMDKLHNAELYDFEHKEKLKALALEDSMDELESIAKEKQEIYERLYKEELISASTHYNKLYELAVEASNREIDKLKADTKSKVDTLDLQFDKMGEKQRQAMIDLDDMLGALSKETGIKDFEELLEKVKITDAFDKLVPSGNLQDIRNLANGIRELSNQILELDSNMDKNIDTQDELQESLRVKTNAAVRKLAAELRKLKAEYEIPIATESLRNDLRKLEISAGLLGQQKEIVEVQLAANELAYNWVEIQKVKLSQLELENRIAELNYQIKQKRLDIDIEGLRTTIARAKALDAYDDLSEKDKEELKLSLLQLKAYKEQKLSLEEIEQIRKQIFKQKFEDEKDPLAASLRKMEGEWKKYDENLKKLQEDVATEMRNSFSDIFFDGIKGQLKSLGDYFKSIFDRILRYFTNLFADMAAQALIRPIIVPIMSMAGGATQLITGQQVNGLNNLTGLGATGAGNWINNVFGYSGSTAMGGLTSVGYSGGFTSALEIPGLGPTALETPTTMTYGATPLGWIMAPLAGYGIGSMFGGQGGIGGAIGGLGGYLLGTLPSVITAVSGVVGGEVLGMTLGSILPGIGTIIGGLLGGLIGSLFKEAKKIPQMGIAYSETGNFPDLKYGGTYTMGNYGFVTGGGVEGDTPEMKLKFLQGFQKMREEVMEAFEDMGLDITGFAKDWSKTIDLEGKSQEEVMKALKGMMGEYIAFASGIDFSQWQKSGEELGETVLRIVDAVMAIPKLTESIDDYISAIEGNYDAIAKWKDQMIEAEDKIKDLRKSLDETTDPADAVNYANQLKQAIYEKYLAEKQMIESLVNEIDNLEMGMNKFAFDLQSKIDQLTGSADAAGIALSRMQYAMDKMQYYKDKGNYSASLNWLNEYTGSVDQWLSSSISAVQARYAEIEKAARENIEQQRKNIDAQIDSLNTQLNVIKGWASLLDSIKKTILDLKTGLTNPQDVFARLAIAKGELDRVMGLYQGSSGETRLKYAGEANELLQKYLSIAQDAYQRPSPEYQSIYDSVIANLELIQADAQSYAGIEISIEEQIRNLQEQANALQQQETDYSAQMQAEIDALNQEAAAYYEWAKTEGVALYQAAIADMKEKLASVLGDKTVEQYLSDLQLAAVTELVSIRNILEDIRDTWANAPAHQSGLSYVPYDNYPAILHRGERVLTASENKAGRTVNLTISPNITITADNKADKSDIAQAVRKAVVDAIKYDPSVRKLVEAI